MTKKAPLYHQAESGFDIEALAPIFAKSIADEGRKFELHLANNHCIEFDPGTTADDIVECYELFVGITPAADPNAPKP